MNTRAALYSAIDDEITLYDLDVPGAALVKRGTVRTPSFVQYAWPHPSRDHLYVTTSNRGPGLAADFNHVSAYRIDRATGELTPHGERKPLPARAVHMCVDPSGRFALNAHNLPASAITVHRIEDDGALGAEVGQREKFEYGTYPHQILVTRSGRTALLVDRGNSAARGKGEDPGALRSFAFDDGVLSRPDVVAPHGGYGFGPRHVDFHPGKPWLYVSDERASKLYMFRMQSERIEAEPAYTRDTLAEPGNLRPRQLAGTIHVHPSGTHVYVANRADHKIDFDGQKVFGGGENSIAVYRIDSETGEPTLIQHADTHALHVRTFAFDPTGRLLVAASIKPMRVRDGESVRNVPAGMSVFRVRDDGTLDYVRTYDVDAEGRTHYWMGIVGLS